MLALLDAPTHADTPLPHQCTDRPALESPWCPGCSALLDQWIAAQDVLDTLVDQNHPNGHIKFDV
jgi:hypothetical protein